MHNSPETTPGGRALKFYASVRLDIRRMDALKQGTESIGVRTKVKVVKNKLAPPFREAEFDVMYGEGISREGNIIDMGVEQGIVEKSGTWFSYRDQRIGQGRDNARKYLKENPKTAAEIETAVRSALGLKSSRGRLTRGPARDRASRGGASPRRSAGAGRRARAPEPEGLDPPRAAGAPPAARRAGRDRRRRWWPTSRRAATWTIGPSPPPGRNPGPAGGASGAGGWPTS